MKYIVLILTAVLLAPLAALRAADSATLRAGAAAVDITPKEFPLNMPGGFSANMADSAHDPLHARALVLDDGTTTLAMVVVDNLGAGPEVLDEAKEIASQKTGIPTDKMLVSLHAHAQRPRPSSTRRTSPRRPSPIARCSSKASPRPSSSAHAALRPGRGRRGGASAARGSLQPPLVSQAGQDAAQSLRQARHR